MIDLTPKYNSIPMKDKVQIPDASVFVGSRVGGMETAKGGFRKGYGNETFSMDSRGIWLGAPDFDEAPFRVNMRGDVVASKVTTDNVYQHFSFESAPDYGVVTSGANTSWVFNSGQAQLEMADNAGAYGYFNPGRELPRAEGALNPYMQCTLVPSLESNRVRFYIGFPNHSTLPHSDLTGFYGFYIDVGANTLRVYYTKNSAITYTTITGINLSNKHIYAVRMTNEGKTLEYLVDGVVVHKSLWNETTALRGHDVKGQSSSVILFGAHAHTTTPTEFLCAFSETIFYYNYN